MCNAAGQKVKKSLNPTLKEKMISRALQSERDIEAGHLFSQEEVVQLTQRK